jgi:hypothetical protein
MTHLGQERPIVASGYSGSSAPFREHRVGIVGNGSMDMSSTPAIRARLSLGAKFRFEFRG